MNGDLALSELRREVSVALAEVRGDARLVLQRGDQSERRMDELTRLVAQLDEQLEDLERTAVTRADLEKRQARTSAVLGIVVAATGVLSSTVTATVIAIVSG